MKLFISFLCMICFCSAICAQADTSVIGKLTGEWKVNNVSVKTYNQGSTDVRDQQMVYNADSIARLTASLPIQMNIASGIATVSTNHAQRSTMQVKLEMDRLFFVEQNPAQQQGPQGPGMPVMVKWTMGYQFISNDTVELSFAIYQRDAATGKGIKSVYAVNYTRSKN